MNNRDSNGVYKVKDVKKDYIIQYSHPTKKRIAVSDWLEKTTIINSDSKLNAIKQFKKIGVNKMNNTKRKFIENCEYYKIENKIVYPENWDKIKNYSIVKRYNKLHPENRYYQPYKTKNIYFILKKEV